MMLDFRENVWPGIFCKRSALIARTFSTTSNNLGLPGTPNPFKAGETARQIVFSSLR
jgi:hypothetical protein